MKIENPAAFNFIFQDDIYLVKNDKITCTPSAKDEESGLFLETPEGSFNYLGKNKKQFLIIVNYPAVEFMEGTHLAALESTLKRLNYNPEDAAIFNISKYPGALFKQIADFFKPRLLLILGQRAIPAGIEAPAFNQLHRINDCTTLFTFGFDEMMNSTENKKTFWEQMKQL